MNGYRQVKHLHDAALDEIVAFVKTQLVHPDPAHLNGKKSAGKRRESTPPCLVSRLSSRNCPNIKTALRTVNAGFINRIDLDPYDDDGDAPAIAASGLKSAALPAEDLQNLLAWYTHRYRTKKLNHDEPKLVVLLEDLEGMQSHVIASMIENLAAYAGELPLVLLIGVATSADAINQAVWRGITNQLNTSTFFVEPGISAFNAVMRDYLYMIHYGRPEAWATQLLDAEMFDRLPQDMAERLASLPSCRSLEPSDPLVQALSFDNLDSLRQAIAIATSARHSWASKRMCAFSIVLSLQEFWDKSVPMEKMLRSLHDGTMGAHIDSLGKLVLQSSSTKIPALLEAVTQEIEIVTARHPGSTDHVFAELVSTAQQQFDEILSRPRATGRQNLLNGNTIGQDLMHSTLKPGEADKAFTRWIKEFATQLADYLRASFISVTSLPMHESWLLDRASDLQKTFNPSLLTSIQDALCSLVAPHSGHSASGTLSRTRIQDQALLDPPMDIAIAYKMYLETGKNVNLADWFSAWEGSAFDEHKTVSDNGKRRRNSVDGRGSQFGSDADDDERDEEEIMMRKQARFIRAIGDLGFMGFIHPTARKAEHVTKSVF
ncbi:Origin recognition complex subunit 3 [Microbotryomycetes sp. JL221]|nr:Origin recognition complex subunit 3 [Microbotryomycetes sp. JL221]